MARYLKPNALGKVAKLVQNDPSPGPPGARYARPFSPGRNFLDTPRQPAHAGGAPRPRRPRRRRLADALLLAALALPLHACSLPADKPGDVNAGANAGAATPAASPATAPAQTNAAKATDKGDFKVARHEGGDGLSAKERAEMAEE